MLQRLSRIIFCGWLLVLVGLIPACSKKSEDQFTQLMTRGNGFFEKGEATHAITTYLKAIAIAPESLDAWLNLANAYLLAADPTNAIEQSRQALSLHHNSAATYYLKGCA